MTTEEGRSGLPGGAMHPTRIDVHLFSHAVLTLLLKLKRNLSRRDTRCKIVCLLRTNPSSTADQKVPNNEQSNDVVHIAIPVVDSDFSDNPPVSDTIPFTPRHRSVISLPDRAYFRKQRSEECDLSLNWNQGCHETTRRTWNGKSLWALSPASKL